MAGHEDIGRETRALGWLHKLVLGMFGLAICSGIFVPLYTDEVGWRFQERAAIDGVDKLFNELCGPNTLAVPPFFMMPMRYYSAVFNTLFADPFYVRVSGILYALAWGVMLALLVRRIARDRADRTVLAVLGFGLMLLGMMPWMLVWSRPEQPIVLATTAALLFAWSKGEGTPEASARAAWLRSLAVVAFAAIAFSYHAKAAFVLPVFLACLFFASRGRAANLPRLVMGALLVAVALWSAHYWVARLQCPDDALLRAASAKNSMGVELVFSRNPAEVLAALGKIFGNITLIKYFGLVAPRPDPMSAWLAEDQVTAAQWMIWHKGLIIAWTGAVILTAVALGLRAVALWRDRRLDARVVYPVTLLTAVLAWSATQAARNIYEDIFVLPFVVIAALIALSGSKPGGGVTICTRVLAGAVGIGAIVSPIAVAAIYAPSVARSTEARGRIVGQPFSIPVFGYAALKPDIVGAARLCGITDPRKARALMVDDLTYFAMMESRLPQHRLGVLGLWRGSITDPMAYLRSRGSSGAILACRFLPEDLRRQAKSQGQFCCLMP